MDCQGQAKIFAALSDPVRLRIVQQLSGGESRSGSALAEQLGISLALLCHHTRILLEAGLITKKKEGQTAFFTIQRDVLTGCMENLLKPTASGKG